MIADPGDLPRNEPSSGDWRAERTSPDKPLDDGDWRDIRADFDLKSGWTFLNHGTLGPTPRGVSDAYHNSIDELARDPAGNHRDTITAIRARLADFVNADIDEVSLTRSTTEGMNLLAHGLDWSAGDEVIIGTHEHFAGLEPYRTLRDRVGIRIVEIAVPAPPATPGEIVAAYESAVTSRTRLIVVSHVSYVTGLIAPVRELTDLAHRNGLLISVDGAQSFGVLPLDLHATGVDHYAGSGQKWFLAGTGTGFSYIRRQLQERVWPSSGYHDLNGDHHGPHAGQRYERVGQRNIPSLLAIGAALDLQGAIGPQNILQRIRERAARLRAGLRSIPEVRLVTADDPALTAGLTTFTAGDLAPDYLVTALREKYRIVVRSINHADVNAVRASTHYFNTLEEVDLLVSAVRSLISRRTAA